MLLVLAVRHILLWSESSQFPVCVTALKVTQLLGKQLACVWRVYHANCKWHLCDFFGHWPPVTTCQSIRDYTFFPTEQRLSERHQLVSTPVCLRPNWTTPIPTPSNRPGEGKCLGTVWITLHGYTLNGSYSSELSLPFQIFFVRFHKTLQPCLSVCLLRSLVFVTTFTLPSGFVCLTTCQPCL